MKTTLHYAIMGLPLLMVGDNLLTMAFSPQQRRVTNVMRTTHRIPGRLPLSEHHHDSSRLSMSSDEESPPSSANTELEGRLERTDLKGATRMLKEGNWDLTRETYRKIFYAVEERTRQENIDASQVNMRALEQEQLQRLMEYPLESPARMEMTDLYQTLQTKNELQVFGACGNSPIGPNKHLPAEGSKIVTPNLLETITGLSMVALTPQPTNSLLLAGVGLALLEGLTSVVTGIDINVLIIATLLFALLDQVLVSGAVFETAIKIVQPNVNQKILRHEAGHFLCAYLLGCPVEGCVLSSWVALKDSRFGGRQNAVSAGTSFFDPELSAQVNGKQPLSRSSIDRYSIIVMGGIAAEASYFGRADGGAGDEMALVQFLSNINPRGGGALTWTPESIKNQARWGALQAVLLLRQYQPSYDALVDALERGGELGDCIYAIESAAKENNLQPLQQPLGYILDDGLYGSWSKVMPTPMETDSAPTTSMSSTTEIVTETSAAPAQADLESSEKQLQEYRKMMEEKLKDIDEQLNNLE